MKFEALLSSNDAEVRKSDFYPQRNSSRKWWDKSSSFFLFSRPFMCSRTSVILKWKSSPPKFVGTEKRAASYVVTPPRRCPLLFVKSCNFRNFEHKWHKSMKEFQNPVFFNLFFISWNNLSTHGTLFLTMLILENFGSRVNRYYFDHQVNFDHIRKMPVFVAQQFKNGVCLPGNTENYTRNRFEIYTHT